ncbi:hypothetical protein BDP81DRAFT_432836 [Colletotrichum phormii]|uniref:Uncharacterized protein n=1 Tax=Colletotrichum phormii TaxID=359342 RepID=A0AAI9ZML0_9PEZI|nr:uncharacterized protein BDP81DRAFT_432836 [Colletotrichum phormii]KAK1634446.1 hypothetical protein BDP81DRAFT_432836 [Colletotrichum phormii]
MNPNCAGIDKAMRTTRGSNIVLLRWISTQAETCYLEQGKLQSSCFPIAYNRLHHEAISIELRTSDPLLESSHRRPRGNSRRVKYAEILASSRSRSRVLGTPRQLVGRTLLVPTRLAFYNMFGSWQVGDSVAWITRHVKQRGGVSSHSMSKIGSSK